MSREAFETAALAAHPTGESSPLAAQRMQPGADTCRCDGGAAAPAPRARRRTPVVTIYGTSWCGACRAARQYLTERKIPFADKDVERDADAARELAGKAAKMGIPTDRVPVIDVRGRLLLGSTRRASRCCWESRREAAEREGWRLAAAGGARAGARRLRRRA